MFPIDVPCFLLATVFRYRVEALIGTGGFSRAYRARSVTYDRTVCLKLIQRDCFDTGMSELRVHSRLLRLDPKGERPLLRMLDAFHFREHLCLVTELLGPSLFAHYVHLVENESHPQYYTASRVATIAQQVLTGLSLMHKHGITHGDVKTGNICFVGDIKACRVKIIDFNAATFSADSHVSYYQSRFYRAPEVALGCRYGCKIDLWGLGCVLVEITLGWIIYQVPASPLHARCALLMSDFNRVQSTGLTRRTCSSFAVLSPTVPIDMWQFGSIELILAAHMATRGPFPPWMLTSRLARRYIAADGDAFEVDPRSMPNGVYRLRQMPQTMLREVLTSKVDSATFGDVASFSDYAEALLTLDPNRRPSADEARMHPWLERTGGPAATPSTAQAMAENGA